MANRDRHPVAAVRLAIGAAVCDARARGVTWKTLEISYDRGRMQLWRYAQEAKKCGIAANDTSALWTGAAAVSCLEAA